MLKRLFGTGLFTAFVLLLAACAQPTSLPSDNAIRGLERNAHGYADITVEQLAAMLEDKDFLLVNVHIPYEGDLPDTDLSIPYDEVADHLDLLPDQDAAIVLYCRSGGMSAAAARVLADLGYTQLMELNGGFSAWRAAGHPLVHTR